jgi:hypothetical protein
VSIKELTLKEFLEKGGERGLDLGIMHVVKNEILESMRKEGFTDEQVYEMKMDTLWPLWIETYSSLAEQYLTELAMTLKNNPASANILTSHHDKAEKLLEELEADKKRRERTQEEIK